MVLVADLESKAAEIEQCTSAAQIADIRSQTKPFKAAYADLVSMCRGAAARLKSSVADVEKQQSAEQQEASSHARKRGRPVRPARTSAAQLVVEQPSSTCAEIASVVIGQDGAATSEWNCNVPTILRLSARAMEETLKPLADAGIVLAGKFKGDASHSDPGRMHTRLAPEVAELLTKDCEHGQWLFSTRAT